MAGEVNKGLEGVVVADSTICLIQGMKGKLSYRGYDIKDLAEKCCFEEVTYLLLYEKLPNAKELAKFKQELIKRRHIPDHVVEMMKTFAKKMNSTEALRSTVSALSDDEPDPRDVNIDHQLDVAISLTAKFPTIVAHYYRLKHKMKLVKPNPKLGHAANFLYMLTGNIPDEISERAMDMDFVLHAEHGFNASTFGVRVTVSTLSDMYSAMTTGIGVLKGPLHGGAAQEVMQMLEEIGWAKNVEAYVKKILAKHGRVMGYGHRIYKTYDPRAKVLKKMAKEFSKKKNNMRWFEIGEKLEEVMAREKNLYPNVDFYSAIVYHHLGLPLDLDTPIFAIARITGWSAHAIAQYKDNRLIRPIENYIGPTNLKFVPLEKR